MEELSRSEFVSRGARGGIALIAGGALLGLATPARADETPPAPAEEDLALVRLAASAELLAIDFYTQAIAARSFEKGNRGYLSEARANEREHYAALAQVLGPGAPVADDFQFTYPEGTFSSQTKAVNVGVQLETAFLGAYLGAVGGFLANDFKSVAGQIGASEAQHQSVLLGIRGSSPIGPSFPPTLDVEAASVALDPYLGD
jgi:hypothetical protein